MGRISKNTGLVVFSNLIEKGLTFILFTLMARSLGPVHYGDFFTAFVFVSIAYSFAEMGLSTLTHREVAKCNDDAQKYFGNMLIVRCVALIIITAAILFILSFLRYNDNVKYGIVLLSVFTLLQYLSHPFLAIFRAVEKFNYYSLLITVDRFITLIICFFFLNLSNNLLLVESGFILGGLTRIIFGILCIKNVIRNTSIQYEYNFSKKMIKEAFPFGLNMILALVYFRLDTLFLSYMGFDGEGVGLYNASFNIYVIMTMPVLAFSMVSFSKFSQLYASDKSQYKALSFRILVLVILSGVFIGVFVFLSAKLLIVSIYGTDFLEAVIILKILSFAVIFSTINYYIHSLLTAGDSIKKLIVIYSLATALNASLNLLVIPKFGPSGASITTVVSELFIVFYSIFILQKSMPENLSCKEQIIHQG